MSTNGSPKEGDNTGRSLKAALRKARLVQAERNDALADLRAAEKARLDMLADEIAPIFNEIPNAYDFEGVVSAGTRPRLWIDMLAFVVMAEDKRTYRFMKDSRLGRDLIFESEDVSQLADRITEYLAHRVLERERALDEHDGIKATSLARKTRKSGDGDEIEEEIKEDISNQSEFEEEEDLEAGPTPSVRTGFSFGALFLSFLLGAGACFAFFAAAGLGYIKF